MAARMALASEERALSPRASSSWLLAELLSVLVFGIGVQKVLATIARPKAHLFGLATWHGVRCAWPDR